MNYHTQIRKLSRALAKEDSGVSAILIALCMVVLLGFAAVAIDAAGVGFNERRQDQSASDVGALTAVQFAVTTNLGNPCSGAPSQVARCNGASEAIEVANLTLDDPSLANWSDPSLCGTPPSGFTAASASQCIAFNSNAQRAWVRIPTIDRPTFLAGVIGFGSIGTSADAIAGADVDSPGAVLPFLLPGSASSANYECLKAFANPDFGPCSNSPVSGNFGSADFFLYGNVTTGWTEKCSGDTNGRLVANIARGVDHPLSTHPTGNGSGVQETANCPVFSAQPNMVDSQSGVGSNLEQGLVYGDSAYSPAPYPGRIQDSGGYLVRNGGGSTPDVTIDDSALWTYLIPGLTSPSSCASVVNATQMEICIADAKAAATVIFTDDLVESLRFGWVPELWESDFSAIPSGKNYHIKDFRPVYLDTTWYGCQPTECSIMHTPGVTDSGACLPNPLDPRITCGTPGTKTEGLQAITSYILSQSIVPDNAKTPSPGSINQRFYNLTE